MADRPPARPAPPGAAPAAPGTGFSPGILARSRLRREKGKIAGFFFKKKGVEEGDIAVFYPKGRLAGGVHHSSLWRAVTEVVSEMRLPPRKIAESRVFIPFSEQEGKW